MNKLPTINGGNGQVLMHDGTSAVWVPFKFVPEFDDVWTNRYAIKCDKMARKFAWDTNRELETYGRIYKLCEFLWKLKVWKP